MRAPAAEPAVSGPAPVVARRLEFNFILLAAGEFLAKLCTFLAFSHLARSLGPERYGSMEFVLALMIFFSLAVEFGLGHYGTRELARNTSQAGRYLRQIVGLRLLLAAATFLILMGLMVALNKDPAVEQLLLWYGFSLFGGPFLLQWFFQAHDRMALVAAANTLRQLIFAVCVLLLFRSDTPLYMIGVFECLSVVTVGVFCLAMIRHGLGLRLQWPEIGISLRPHWNQSLPIGITELSWAFTWYFATVTLGLIFANESLGWFSASHRLLMALHTFVFLYFFNLLPSISRCAGQPHTVLRKLMDHSVRFAAWTSIFVAFLLTILSREVVTMVYGDNFAQAQASIVVLAWILPVAMLSGHHRYILIAYNLQDKLLRCTLASAALAIAIGPALVWSYGDVGAAWALLIANTVQFALAYYYVRKHVTRVAFRGHLWRPLAALAVGFVLFYGVKPLQNPWMAAGIAASVYSVALLVCNGRDAMRLLRSVLGSPRGQVEHQAA
jgi:O-antigen/teichoic acid export membrane protein